MGVTIRTSQLVGRRSRSRSPPALDVPGANSPAPKKPLLAQPGLGGGMQMQPGGMPMQPGGMGGVGQMPMGMGGHPGVASMGSLASMNEAMMASVGPGRKMPLLPMAPVPPFQHQAQQEQPPIDLVCIHPLYAYHA